MRQVFRRSLKSFASSHQRYGGSARYLFLLENRPISFAIGS